MTTEADMSRPSKRFVLPYEPDYTAHRTDRRTGRAMQIHRLVREHVISPGLVPNVGVGESVPGKGSIRPNRSLEIQRTGIPHKN